MFDYNGTIRAYESVRYNDGKGTVESMSRTMYDSEGVALKTTNYTYTYGDPLLGQMPDVLYSLGTGSRTYSFTYDDLGRLTGRSVSTEGNDIYEAYTYAQHDLYTSYTTPLVETFRDFTGKTHTYTYDSNGNILTDTYDGQTASYVYDNLNRLVRYNDPVYGWTYVYVYDDRGNITEMQEHYYSTGTLGAPHSVIEYEYTDSTWADLMTSYWGEDIEYDNLGNPKNWINGESLEWENGRQLVSYDDWVYYSYNADGLRTKKSGAKETEYYIANGTYLGEVTEINGTEYVISYFYDENGAPAGIYVNDSVYYFAKNIQGDVTAIVNYEGDVLARYRYDAYGAIIGITNASGYTITNQTHVAHLNPFRYRGYMYDEESGFYYLRSRYYDPYVGRFLNADGVVATGVGFDGNNMFAYCVCNPVNAIDNGGQSTEAFAWWTTTMWWLCVVDTTLPIGDIVYVGGIIVTGVAVGIATIGGFEIAEQAKAATESKTRKLVDVLPVIPKNDVYMVAFVDTITDMLKIIRGFTFSYSEAIMINTLAHPIVRQVKLRDGGHWGIYTPQQEHAKALADYYGYVECPEVHDSGYYGHYHDGSHTFHIWFGEPII